MIQSTRSVAVAVLGAILISGCGGGEGAGADDAASGGGIPERYWSSVALEEAQTVSAVRESAADGAEIVVQGRIKDFVEGRAVFTLIDRELKSCREMEDDPCPTPWDYCCVEPDVIAANTITVEVRDDEGRPLRADVAGFHDLDHLQELTVRGKAIRDEAGNVIVNLAAMTRP